MSGRFDRSTPCFEKLGSELSSGPFCFMSRTGRGCVDDHLHAAPECGYADGDGDDAAHGEHDDGG
eukprot:14820101-Alexandrium_andersonii.AAC.1